MGDGGFSRGWPYSPPGGRSSASRAAIAQREHALACAPLFGGLSKRHLRTIARVAGTAFFEEGTVIAKEGAPGAVFLVLIEGSCEVTREGKTISHLAPGDFFGEISLLDGGPRSATVIADTPVHCITLSSRDFRAVVASEPSVAVAIMRTLARRLREREGPLA